MGCLHTEVKFIDPTLIDSAKLLSNVKHTNALELSILMS